MATYSGQATAVAKSNTIMNGLLEPIALQLLHDVQSENPLFEVFEREPVDTAKEIEEIIIGDANVEEYDATGKTALTPRDTWNIARYYNEYDHKVYTTTKYRNEIRSISISPENEARYVASLVNGLARKRDDWTYEKQKAILKDITTTYPKLKAATITAGDSAVMGEALTIAIRDTIDNLRFKNFNFVANNIDNETSTKFKQRAYLEQIRIIVPYKVFNRLNIGWLANVYNLDKTELLSKIVTIDTDDGIVYVIDKRSVFRYPQTDEILEQENAEGNFTTYFLHVNAMMGFSPLFKFAFIDASAMNPAAGA